MKKTFSALFTLILLVSFFEATSQVSLLKDINPGSDGSWSSADNALCTIGNVLFFAASDPNAGFELWKTDGTPAGTVMVKDINPGIASSSPNNFYNVNGVLFFTANDGAKGIELWKSDGTDAGTVMIKDIAAGATNGVPNKINNPKYFHVFNNLLFFSAYTSTAGNELWKSDGTSSGTVLVKDIYTGPFVYDSNPDGFEEHNGVLYFAATNGTNGRELWKTNGTSAGTTLVKDIQTTGFGDSDPSDLRSIGSTLIFIADDGVHSAELWKTDGTAAGTQLVKDIKTNTSGGTFTPSGFETQPGSFENRFTRIGDIAFFGAIDDSNGKELWKTDGTTAGTVMVKNASALVPPDGSAPKYFAALGNEVFYSFEDVGFNTELWKSDGTEPGTQKVKEISSLSGSIFWPAWIYSHQGKIYLSADDNDHGIELWESDGTGAGTKLVADIKTGFESSYPGPFFSLGKKLIFWAYDDVSGQEPRYYIPPIQASATKTDVLCKGDSTGSILLSSNGTAPFSVAWSPNWVSGGVNPTNLPAGNYSATLTDADGATATTAATISEPVSAIGIATTTIPANGTASDGSATANPSGGTPPYSWLWNTVPPQTGQTAVGLLPGLWSCTVSDANGCTSVAISNVSSIINAVSTTVDVLCKGDSTGKISVVSNGLPPLSINWSPGWLTGFSPENLPAGVYQATVSDANGATAVLSATVNEPDLLTVSTTTTPATVMQSSGTATAVPSGGTPPFEYLWNSAPPQTGQTATGLPGGNYDVIVTDNNGCTALTTTEVKEIVASNDLIHSKSVQIFPNPATELVQLIFNEPVTDPASLLLLDLTGKRLLSIQIRAGVTRLSISTEELPSGSYFIQLLTDAKIPETQKLIICH